MGRSAIQKEGEKLKKVVLECSHEVSEQSCLISNDKDRSVVSFFLFMGSIRDNPLKVTGWEEGEKLKKVGLECPPEVSQQSCLISNEKVGSVMSFFLFLGSIRDNPLKVTGGVWFGEIIYCLELLQSIVLDFKCYNLRICNSGEGEKLKKVGLECPQELCQQSCLISKEKDKSVISFFLLLGSIRDNLLRVTGGAVTFYSTDICGLIFEITLNSKRYEISSALNHLSRLSGNVNPPCTIAINLKLGAFNEIKNFKSIVLLTGAVDKALTVCVLFLYCEICSMIFITISLAISKERSFQLGLEPGQLLIAWNFINQFYFLYNVTMGGSAIQKKGEKLKKVGWKCSHEVSQQSFLIPNEKDRTVKSFFLFLGSIRSNPLRVTGGGMFVIQKKIFLTVMNAVVSYSIIMFQLSV
ncbi:uncharacterized protein CDAR_378041 [Caerostris darwini]|uniref:Gustatory receptor n=1 Tax=Caerostris darwini TaxID=1538125 RepID=A0AAV4PH99_9ARAC|nr:uncharacterized protein CDAR_378041 [Caerostris darwini]